MDAQAASEKTNGQDGAVPVVKENKSTTGKVGFINSQFIAIVEESDAQEGFERETLYYLDKDTTVKRKNSLSELKVGDTVKIDYEKTTKASKGVQKSKKVVKDVDFLRGASGEKGSLISK
jgi:hypothetical protein